MRCRNILSIAICLTTILFSQISNSFAGTIEEMADTLVNELADNLKKSPLEIKIGKMTIENTNYSSEFADKFLDLVESGLKTHESDFKTSGKTRGLVRLDAGRIIEGESAVLEGSYREDAQRGVVLISARIVDKDGNELSSSNIKVERSSIKWDIKPPNISEIKETEKEVGSAIKNDFKVDLWIDKGDGGIYRKGEEISIWVKCEVDCYLKVLYLDAEGNRTLMFPTKHDIRNSLRKGEIYSLHEKNTYEVSPPFGSEMIIAFASTEPIKDKGEVEIGGGFKGFNKGKKVSEIVDSIRGVKVGGKSGAIISKRGEARVYLTTVKE